MSSMEEAYKATNKLDPEDAKNAQDLDDDTAGDIYYKKIEMPFEFFEGSDINDLIQRMLAYIKAQTENPNFPESGFTLDKIMPFKSRLTY